MIFRKKSDMNVYRVAAYKSNTWKEVAVMKIGEAQQAYRGQVQAYQSQRSVLAKQLEEVKKRMKYSPETKEKDEQEAATLELTLEALDEKKDEYQEYLKREEIMRLLRDRPYLLDFMMEAVRWSKEELNISIEMLREKKTA